MIETVLGIGIKDLLKIKQVMDNYEIDDVDFFLSCFDEDKFNERLIEKLNKQKEIINKKLSKARRSDNKRRS